MKKSGICGQTQQMISPQEINPDNFLCIYLALLRAEIQTPAK